MKKRCLTVVLTALLGAGLGGVANAQATTSSTLSDSRLSDANISVNTGQFSGDLSKLLSAIARSAGYELVFDVNVDALPTVTGASATPGATGGAPKPIVYNFSQKPFNEVWPLILDVYGLNYEVIKLGGKDVIRVSNSPIQRIVLLKLTDSQDMERRVKLFFGTPVYTTSTRKDASGADVTEQVLADIKLDSPTLRIVAGPDGKSLIVRGTNREILDVERLVADIERQYAVSPPVPSARQTYTVRSSASQLIPAVTAQFPDVKASYVEASNQLVLNGPAPQVTAALALLDQVDRAQVASTTQRIYTVLGNVDDAVAVLGAQFPGVRTTPVGKTGQLILNGPSTQVEAALALLGQVDRAPVPVAAAPNSVQRVYAAKGSGQALVDLLKVQYPNLQATLVGTTGQVVVAGPSTQVEAALALIAQVDRAPTSAPSVVQRTFTLLNARATEVRDTLNGTLQRDLTTATPSNPQVPITATDANGNPVTVTVPSQNQGAQTGQQNAQTAPAVTPAGAPTIIADERTNTLIVRGTPEQVAQIAELVPQLDVRVPQINVQVRIQEVSDTATRSLGIDWTAGIGNFVTKIVGGQISALFDVTQSLAGLNLGASLKALETQGLTKNIYEGSVTLQSGQRRQGNQGTTESSSANAAASIKSGGRLELNIPSTSGNIVRQIDYGVNIDFFNPQVNADGTITIGVRGNVSNPATAITGGTLPNLLNFTNREATTTVSFKSGQTVMLGGLLGTEETNTTNGVPFLSSLPLVGNLFKTESRDKTQSQLLIVITGNVVQ